MTPAHTAPTPRSAYSKFTLVLEGFFNSIRVSPSSGLLTTIPLTERKNAPGVGTPDAFFARHFIMISLADFSDVVSVG
jgi:hypothetical protein